MAVTPNYSIPYPALTDAPNGPAEMQSLATQVDTSLLTVQAYVDSQGVNVDAQHQFACYVYATAAQSVPNASSIPVLMNTEVWDPAGMHDPAVNTSRVVARKTGYYKLGGQATFTPNALHGRVAYFQLNGTTAIPGSGCGCQGIDLTYSPAMALPDTIVHLNINDYIELIVGQNCGTALNTQAIAQNVCSILMEFYHS